MPKHIQGRTTMNSVQGARPYRVSGRRAPPSSNRLSDAMASHCAALLVDRLADRETELVQSNQEVL